MARKKLNKKLVLLLSLFASLSMIVLSIMMITQLRSADPERFVELAVAAEANENFEQAALLYLKAFERSGDAIHLVRRGEAALNGGDISAALRSYQEAAMSSPDLIEVHIKQIELRLELCRLYGSAGDWQALKDSAEQFLATDTNKMSDELAFARHANGLALVNLGAQDESFPDLGLAQLEEARKLAPTHAEYAIDLSTRYVLRDRHEDGEAILRELVKAHPDKSPEASKVRLAYARFLTGRNRTDEAVPLFAESIEFAAGDDDATVEAKSGHAVYLSQQWAKAVLSGAEQAEIDKLLARAESTLVEAIAIDPKAFEPVLQLAYLYQRAGRQSELVAICEQRLALGFSRKGIEKLRNSISVFGLNLRASEACVALSYDEPDVDKRAEWLDRAEQYLADARGEFPNHAPAYHQEGKIYLARGHDRAALEAFRAADDRYRAFTYIDWNNKRDLARLHLQLGEPGAARDVLDEVYEEARTQRGNDRAFWLLYAQALFQTGNEQGALTWANRLLAANPDDNAARQLVAAIKEARGEHGRAGDILDDSGTVSCLLGAKQLLLDGDRDGAFTAIMACLEEHPTDLLLVRAAVGEMLAQNMTEKAIEVVDRAIAGDPESRRLKELKVLIRPDLTQAQRDQAILDLINMEEDAYRRALEMVAFHIRGADPDGAIAAIDEAEKLFLEKATPFARQASIAQYRALLQEKLRMAADPRNDRALQEARDAAIEHDVDGAGGQSLVGLYHIHREEWEPAVAALKAALELQATDARSMAQLGQCLIMLDKSSEAQGYLERAVTINPKEPIAQRALGRLAQSRGDIEAFDRHLSICEKLIPNDPWVRAGLFSRRDEQDPAAAIVQREAALEADPEDVYNLSRLARLCETTGAAAKADRYYTRLLEIRPNQKNVVYAVALFRERTQRPDEGLDIINRYVAAQLDEVDRANGAILVASYYVKLGEIDLAEIALLEAFDRTKTLDLAHSLGEFYLRRGDHAAEALKWFDQAVGLADEADHPQLPRLLGLRIRCLLDRQVNEVQAARRRVDELLARYPDDTAGLLLDSEIHARAGMIDEAIRSLSRYLEKVPANARVLFQRAQHYIAQGRVPQAIEDLETIKRGDPANYVPRLLLARLHRQGGRQDAWIAELESLAHDTPDVPAVVEALVQAYIHTKRFGEADSITTGQINRHRGAPDARWHTLRASVSFALGDYNKALADYRISAELGGYKGGVITALLDAYAAAERFDEGVSYYRSHANKIEQTHGVLSAYALLLARSGETDAAIEGFRRACAVATSESGMSLGGVIRRVLAAFSPEQALGLFEKAPAATARANDRIRIRLLRHKARFDEAADLAARMLDTAKADKERAQLLEERGDALNQAGKANDARTAYEAALGLDGGNWILLNNLAFLLAEHLDAVEEAKPYAERAVAIAETTFTLDTLGWIYVGLGDFTRGIAELNRAIRLDPDAIESYYHLGEAYRRNRQFSEATDTLQRGLDLTGTGTRAPLRAQIEASLAKAQQRDDSP